MGTGPLGLQEILIILGVTILGAATFVGLVAVGSRIGIRSRRSS